LIDGTWTLVVERADEAGRELAQSLLFSCAGNRPIALVGFSFGGRVIYSCLKELARLQEKWEDYYERQARGEVAQWKKDSYFENMREPASIVCDVSLLCGSCVILRLLDFRLIVSLRIPTHGAGDSHGPSQSLEPIILASLSTSRSWSFDKLLLSERSDSLAHVSVQEIRSEAR
jgi:Protein of unknown function (DUF726)